MGRFGGQDKNKMEARGQKVRIGNLGGRWNKKSVLVDRLGAFGGWDCSLAGGAGAYAQLEADIPGAWGAPDWSCPAALLP